MADDCRPGCSERTADTDLARSATDVETGETDDTKSRDYREQCDDEGQDPDHRGITEIREFAHFIHAPHRLDDAIGITLHQHVFDLGHQFLPVARLRAHDVTGEVPILSLRDQHGPLETRPALPRGLHALDDADDVDGIVIVDIEGLADVRAGLVRKEILCQGTRDNDEGWPVVNLMIPPFDLIGFEIRSLHEVQRERIGRMFVGEIEC